MCHVEAGEKDFASPLSIGRDQTWILWKAHFAISRLYHKRDCKLRSIWENGVCMYCQWRNDGVAAASRDGGPQW